MKTEHKYTFFERLSAFLKPINKDGCTCFKLAQGTRVFQQFPVLARHLPHTLIFLTFNFLAIFNLHLWKRLGVKYFCKKYKLEQMLCAQISPTEEDLNNHDIKHTKC